MRKDNVTSIKSSPVTLDGVKQALNAWRSAKKKQNEKIPEALWEQIARLLNVHSEREVRSVLALTPIQMDRAKRLAKAQNGLNEASAQPPKNPMDFCEARQKTASTTVTSLFDVKTESHLSEEDWFAKETQEEKRYQATNNQRPTTPLVYKPAEAFSTATSVVEIRRPDGMLMKIHICTDRFEELLHAFFKG